VLGRVGGSGQSQQVTGHVKTQLIAHDKEVYDIAFSRAGGGRDMFASVGEYCEFTWICNVRRLFCCVVLARKCAFLAFAYLVNCYQVCNYDVM
jgi:hypothetical protein